MSPTSIPNTSLLTRALGLMLLSCSAAGAVGLSCSSLASQMGQFRSFAITNATQMSSQMLNAGELLGIPELAVTNQIPLCRVQAQVPYDLNDTIGVELWLPASAQWNGRYIAVGDGGLAGVIDYYTMMMQLNAGFAVAGGDSGHLESENGNGTTLPGQRIPFLNSVGQTTAWIHNSVAALTPPTQQLANLYYGKAASYSYYYGCSTGGAQGLALAQYHPELFDGIYAGSPGNWYSHLILSFLWNYVHSRNESFLDQDALNLITNATVKKCDALDGVDDGLIENPLKCSFNITTLQCKQGETATVNGTVQCLTPQQVTAYKAFLAGPKESDTGIQIYPGFDLGSESGWMYQEAILAIDYSVPILQNLVFQNLSYDYTGFKFASSDVGVVDSRASPLIDEISPDLSAFKRRGSKMVTTQGWADQYNAATWPITHLKQIDAFLGTQSPAGNASDFYRLFMVPGGGHCGSTAAYPNVPATYHVLDVLMPWVEHGIAPTDMQSSGPPSGANVTRKLCAYPRTAKLSGSNHNDWTAYACVE